MSTVESKTPWSIQGIGVAEQESFGTNLLSLVVLFTLFYVSAYWSVSSQWPVSVPVHHDDYSNYAAGYNAFQWTWIRPLSTALIFLLSKIGPDWLIWAVRCLTVVFVFLVWKILTLVQRPGNYPLILVLYGIAVFSNPIIVEYARYTGMITHLLSGCLGSMAVIYLFRAAFLEYKRGYVFSVVFFLMSVLAKEDFVILYAVSMLVAALAKPRHWRKTLAWSGTGLVLGFTIIAGAKFFSYSSFLGVTDKAASYYLDWSLISLLKTTFVYLSSAGHPSLAVHGAVVLIIFFASAMVALAIFFRYKRFSWAAYFLVAGGSVLFPYSLLPNHVSAYYEFIWWPFILIATYLAIIEISSRFGRNLRPAMQRMLAPVLFLLLTGILAAVDFKGRSSIADWYDSMGGDNQRVITYLLARKNEITQADEVCITGASAFSPWFMHGGTYLSYVLGLRDTWNVVIEPTSPNYAGMMVGANGSSGRVKLISPAESSKLPCLQIDLAGV